MEILDQGAAAQAGPTALVANADGEPMTVIRRVIPVSPPMVSLRFNATLEPHAGGREPSIVGLRDGFGEYGH